VINTSTKVHDLACLVVFVLSVVFDTVDHYGKVTVLMAWVDLFLLLRDHFQHRYSIRHILRTGLSTMALMLRRLVRGCDCFSCIPSTLLCWSSPTLSVCTCMLTTLKHVVSVCRRLYRSRARLHENALDCNRCRRLGYSSTLTRQIDPMMCISSMTESADSFIFRVCTGYDYHHPHHHHHLFAQSITVAISNTAKRQ